MHRLLLIPCLAILCAGTVPAAEMIPGLVGEYYSMPEGVEDFPTIPESTKPVIKRADKTVNFDCGEEVLPGTQLTDRVYVRWTGTVRPPAAGKFTFYTESDDGSRLFINGKQVVSNGGLHGMEEQSGEVELKAGDNELKLEFFENDGGAGCKLFWSNADFEKTIVPASALFHSTDVLPAPAPLQPLPAASDRKPGLLGEYFQLSEDAGDRVPSLDASTKPAVKRVDATVDVFSGEDAWPGTQLTDNIYIRWTGVVRAPKDGRYTFITESDDGSWLTIGGVEVADNGGAHAMQESSGIIDLKAGDHLLRLDYREMGGEAGCKLMWITPGGEKEIIPASALLHPEK